MSEESSFYPGVPDATSRPEPHVFDTSCAAYRALATTGADQTILLSGESGSGKTETAKILTDSLGQLRSLAQPPGWGDDSADAAAEAAADRIVQSGLVLEAFGNASTRRSENSSRFGKFVRLYFKGAATARGESPAGYAHAPALVGSACETYVLEKARVVRSRRKDQNFHIFYQILAADDDFKASVWKGLAGTGADSFRYVGCSERAVIDGESDAERFGRTVRALEAVGVREGRLVTLLRAVCVVLQMGNVLFDANPNGKGGSVVANPKELGKLAEVMGVPAGDLVTAFTLRQVKTGRIMFNIDQSPGEAAKNRDTLAVAVYMNIFEYLVETLDAATAPPKERRPSGGERAAGCINLLDMSGFEADDPCQFEQLCTNYANEVLQVRYVEDNIRAIDMELGAEEKRGVFNYPEVLQLLEGRCGLIAILDEECLRPKATSQSFVDKLKQINGDNSCLIRKKRAVGDEFGIRHYAGEITYRARKFIARNKDAISDDLVGCATKSSNEIVSSGFVTLLLSRGGPLDTVLGTFKRRLKALTKAVRATRCRHVRCIKPNDAGMPRVTDHLRVLEQIRAARFVETLAVSLGRYRHGLFHSEAIDRFRCLWGPEDDVEDDVEDDAEDDSKDEGRKRAERLFERLLSGYDGGPEGEEGSFFVCGRTKIYFRGGSLEYLGARRRAVRGAAAAKVQSLVRSRGARSRFLVLRGAVVAVQTTFRRCIDTTLVRHRFGACVVIQNAFRLHRARSDLRRLKIEAAARRIQGWYRGCTAKKNFVEKVTAVKKIQALHVKWVQRASFVSLVSVAVKDSRADAKMVGLLGDLQQLSVNGTRSTVLERRSREMLLYAREQIHQLKNMTSNQKIENLEISKQFSNLQHRLVSEAAVLEAMKLEMAKLQETVKILQKELSEEKAASKSKEREQEDTLFMLEYREVEFRAEKEAMRNKHRQERAELKKAMDAMERQHAKESSLAVKERASAEDELQRKIDDLKRDIEEEDLSNKLAFRSMMGALNGSSGPGAIGLGESDISNARGSDAASVATAEDDVNGEEVGADDGISETGRSVVVRATDIDVEGILAPDHVRDVMDGRRPDARGGRAEREKKNFLQI